ncbi:hypothetical protein PENTCL1PPCAC_28749 [Pristionchus entomophagus]|uniref:MARVEL domain-containing protein n=1 Tax=Pristionchus entomophagus TaxID=358040 RepID=A0AAV5UHR0_9BILA|nr:hypothetical protein PENTCL1PPCAC_28749 [Pristionchus entomophagus]
MSNRADFYFESYPKTYDVNGKNFLMDMVFLPSNRGLIKVFEIILCFLAMVFIAMSQGVEEERNFGLFASFLGLSCSFTLLVSYVLMLNSKMSQFCWVVIEGLYYVCASILLFIAGIGMWVFCADYWASRNPVWQTWPALAAGTLILATVVFIADLIIIICFYKRYSWDPSCDYSAKAVPTNQSALPTQ